MSRAPILALIEDYRKNHPEEAGTTQRFVEFVERCPNCFERSLQEGHVTGSAWVVNSAGDQVLLTHHRKLNIWVQLGGHADGDNDIAAVALKEAIEESGLEQLEVEPRIFDLDIHRIPARKTDPEHFHYDVRFVVRHSGDGQFQVSEESHDLAWIPLGNLENYTTEESMLRMRRKWHDQPKRS